MEYNRVTPNVVTTAPKTIDAVTRMKPSETVSLTCIKVPGALVIVDCGADSGKASTFRGEMERHYGRKVSHLLLTHSDWDHTDAIDAFQDVMVVISKKGAAKIRADIEVAKTFVLGTGGNEIRFEVSGGHTPDSSYVYYPEDQVLITGDGLLSCYAQVFSNGKVLLELYRHWETLDVEHIIPGHGHVVDKDYLVNVRKYFEELIEALGELKAQELTVNQVLKHEELPGYCYKDHAKWEEGGRRHTGWLNAGVKYWYRHV